MDETGEKLREALETLEREQWRLTNKIAAIRATMTQAGLPLPSSALSGEKEYYYARNLPFAGKRLNECCERIVKDHQGAWLDKGEVVYLLERGGYTSGAREPKNSVDCALRLLASLGKIEVEKSRGPHGNRYRFMPQGKEEP